MRSRSSSDDQYRLRVLMLPWLAHGHISPFLELANRLTQRNCFVYLCSSPVNLSSIEQQYPYYSKDHDRDHQKYTSNMNIHLLELHLPEHLPELPPQRHTTKSLPPHLMSTLKHAFDLSQPSFASILTALKPDLLIYDFIQPWAPATASAMSIPAVLFLTTGAAASSFFHHFFGGASISTTPRAVVGPFPSTEAVYLEEHEVRKLRTRFGGRSNGLTDSDRFYGCTEASTGFIAIKTFRELESKYIDYLSQALGKEILPVGPLVREEEETDHMISTDHQYQYYCEFMSWLDGKERGSTVFVSFGTEYFMSEEEIEEVGLGLELSGVNFIWVVRFPEGAERREVREALPCGFVERVGRRGMVVQGWAPQGKILGHPSTGGFLTHCGWSSVLEGMWFGVPLIALPLQLDQPINARLVVELGVGVEVIRKEGVEEAGKVTREEVAKTIREVMTTTTQQQEEAGDHNVDQGVRGRAKEMSEKMRAKGDEEMINVLVEKLVNLCNNRGSIDHAI